MNDPRKLRFNLSSPVIYQDYVVDAARPLRYVVPDDEQSDGKTGRMLRMLRRHKLLFAIVCLGAVMLSMLLALGRRPMYETNVMVYAAQSGDRSGRDVLGQVADMLGLSLAADSEAELMRSRSLIAQSMRKLDLFASVEPEFASLLRYLPHSCLSQARTLDIGMLRNCLWSAADISVARLEVPRAYINQEFTLTALGQNRFVLTEPESGLSAQGRVGAPLRMETPSGVLELTVNSLHAAPGLRFRVMRRSELAAVQDVQRNLRVTEQQGHSGIVNIALRGSDPARISALLADMSNAFLAGSDVRGAQDVNRRLEYIREKLADARQRLQETQLKFRQFRSGKAVMDPAEEAKSNAQQVIAAKAQKLDLEQKRADLLARFTPNHPVVVAIDTQLRNINNEIRRLDTDMKSLSPLEQENLSLARELKLNTDSYQSLLAMERDLEMTRASAGSRLSLVDAPVVAERPVPERLGSLVAAGALAGIAAGMGAVLLRHKTRAHDIEHASQLEKETSLPVYVSVPYSRQQERLLARSKGPMRRPPDPLAIGFPLDASVESLRQFRATLQFALPQHRNNIVLLTSAEGGSGKSFIAANLAVLFGACHKKVLLIDADLRSGSLGAHIRAGREGGLSETLAGLQGKEALIARDVYPGVDFIAAGSLRGDSAELLQRSEFVECLEAASLYYDVVLINCAPVLEASDSLVLGRHAGAIYLVARSGMSKSRHVSEAVRRFRQVGLSPKGCVFNGTREAAGYSQRSARYAGHWLVAYRPYRKQVKMAEARHTGKIPRA